EYIGRAAEGVRGDDVRARIDIGRVDPANDVGPREVQVLVAALIALAAEVARGKLRGLDHRPHRAIEDENAFTERTRQPAHPDHSSAARWASSAAEWAPRPSRRTGRYGTRARPEVGPSTSRQAAPRDRRARSCKEQRQRRGRGHIGWRNRSPVLDHVGMNTFGGALSRPPIGEDVVKNLPVRD